MRSIWIAVLATAATVVAGAGASADDAVSFKGKTVTISVATTPGGGYDMYARKLATYLPRYLPGSPNVVVRNITGAGGLVLANHLYNRAPKDGTEIAALESGTAFAPYLNGAPVQFEPGRFGWLGSIDKYTPMVLARSTTPFHAFGDLMTKEMSVGGSGPGSNTAGFPSALNAFFGTKFKVINGYRGSNEIILALERGELEGYASWCWHCMKRDRPQWISGKTMRVLLQLSFEGDPELTAMGVPTMRDIAKTDEQIKMMSVVLAPNIAGKPYTAPPDLPPAILAAWRKAFHDTAHDTEFVTEMKRLNSEILFVPAGVIENLLAETAALDAPTLARLQSAYVGRPR